MTIKVVMMSFSNNPYNYQIIGLSKTKKGAQKLIDEMGSTLFKANYLMQVYFKTEDVKVTD